MGFWGVEIKPNKPFIIRSSSGNARGRRLRVTQATLGRGSDSGNIRVQCKVGERRPVPLCVLLPGKVESFCLDLEFEEAEDITFSVLGFGSVHLSGYYLHDSHLKGGTYAFLCDAHSHEIKDEKVVNPTFLSDDGKTNCVTVKVGVNKEEDAVCGSWGLKENEVGPLLDINVKPTRRTKLPFPSDSQVEFYEKKEVTALEPTINVTDDNNIRGNKAERDIANQYMPANNLENQMASLDLLAKPEEETKESSKEEEDIKYEETMEKEEDVHYHVEDISSKGTATTYEKLREERIRENLERMEKLGILDLSLKLKSQPHKTSLLPSDHKKKEIRPSALQQLAPPPSGPVRRSSRLKDLKDEDPKLMSKDKDLGSLSTNPEFYTKEHEKLLGSSEMSWTPFDGERIYDPVKGKTCHQCRQKTLGLRTTCSTCVNGKQGQLCGDCLYTRYGENIIEANKNPNWVCPVCRDICNCSRCRQSKGWAPIGTTLTYTKVLSLGYKSVAHYLIQTRCAQVPEKCGAANDKGKEADT